MMMNKTRTFGVEKFDVVVMNPPYQELKPGFKKSQALWDKFVIKVIEISLIEGGYLVAVHPEGWRNVGDGFDKVKRLLKSKQIIYLEVHDRTDGVNTFGAQTSYDLYCLKNNDNNGNFITKIKCIDDTTQRVNISNLEFIPNGMFDEFKKLLAKPGEEKVELLYDRTAYGTDKSNMSKVQTKEFKYPCIYTTLKDGTINYWYSNTKNNGHFGISKVVWTNGTSVPIPDFNCDYGLTQFAYAIVDEPKNLDGIKKAMLNPEFIKLMVFSQGIKHRYNRNVISLFRKDFWVDFLDYNNDDE